ncbi:MAG: hypothetical protein H6853_06495 [Rhodospirillales bacterium]|nr:hypothetical protein [Alphaproteobacteria bacterium]USO03181.1 MAG: hypothetical protein H6853_06495 [Rhodospirillales bacterium]
MQRIKKPLLYTLVLTEMSHLFCCVLPTVFSIVSLFVGLGLVGAMPPFLYKMHEMIHAWEIPLISFSGAVVALGWVIDAVSARMDCHDTGCEHGPCTPQKRKAHIVLKAATVLFVFNVLIYGVFHYGH